MIDQSKSGFDRRDFLKSTVAVAGAGAAASFLNTPFAYGQTAKLRVGLMLPYTGTFAILGQGITNGFKLAVAELGGKMGGREVEYFVVDDESNPAKAPENANKLISRDKVDILVGSVHSGVSLGISKVVRESGALWTIPMSTANELTGSLCAPNIFRTSFTSWQSNFPLGKILMDRGLKNCVHITWNYVAGQENLAGFKEGYLQAGGKITKELWVPFPNVEFQPLLTEIANIKPDAVVAWFAGAGAAKFLKDYAASGLKGKIPLYGSGYLTDNVLDALGGAAEGVETTFPYGDGLDNKKDKDFRLAYAKMFKLQPDVAGMLGYDTAHLFAAGVNAMKGDAGNKQGMIKAMEAAKIDSPRGPMTMTKAHNPAQNVYLRKVVGKENKVVGIAAKLLADSAVGCKAA